MSIYNIIAVAMVGIMTGVFNWMLAAAGYIAPTMDAMGNAAAAVQPSSVNWVITFSFVGLEVFTGIALVVILLFLNVEKNLEKEQAEIKARRESA